VNGPSRVIYKPAGRHGPTPAPPTRGCDGHGNTYIRTSLRDTTIRRIIRSPMLPDFITGWGLPVRPGGLLRNFLILDQTLPSLTLNTLQSDAYGSGARISTNRWGTQGADGIYDSQAQNYDQLVRDAQSAVAGNQEMVIVFAAGNDGANGAQTVGPPGSAKNVLTVGGVGECAGVRRGGRKRHRDDSGCRQCG